MSSASIAFAYFCSSAAVRRQAMTTALSADIVADEPIVMKAAKQFFDRDRSFVADPTLHNVCPAYSGSYPISHSTNAYLQADVFSHDRTGDARRIFARAANYAYNRLVCGVHYPSDLQAGNAFDRLGRF